MLNKTLLQKGDHVYVGNGKIKHHAIVVRNETDECAEIIEYGAFRLDGKKKGLIGVGKDAGLVRRNTIRVREDDEQRWFKVEYDDDESSSSPISQSPLRSPEEVVEAALFLLRYSKELIPSYHLTQCNCECFARWCKCGSFASGQAVDFYGSLQHHGTNTSSKVASISPLSGLVVWAAGAIASKRHDTAGNRWDEIQSVIDEAYDSYRQKEADTREERNRNDGIEVPL